jgi:glutathione S-transferase
MILHQDPRSPNPRRVRLFLAEKSLTFDSTEVLIAKGAHHSAEFKKKNPLEQLPVMEFDDGRLLSESMAICRYIEELHPSPNLFGADAWERAKIEEWNRRAEHEVLLPIAQVFRNSHAFWVGRIEQAAGFADIMKKLVTQRMSWLNDELADHDFLAGDRFTVADITLLCAIDFGKPSGIRVDPSTLPHLARWYHLVNGRPSAKA